MPKSTDEEYARMLMDIPFPMNVINDQFTLKLADIITRYKFYLDRCYVLQKFNFSILNKAYLGLEIKTVKIRRKLSKIYYFKDEHSNFYTPIFGDF